MNAIDQLAVEMVSTADLIPYARNARTHSEAQVAQIAASIEEFGFVNPVLINADNGIIAGHGRCLAAEQIGMATVPCVRLKHLTEAQERALILADNRLALNAGWDESLLAAELAALQEMDFDIPVIGFDTKELERLFNPDMDASTGKASGTMADEFLIPPFSVLNAREGWWQDRKRQWIALGIQSEVGRGENLLKMSDTMLEPDPAKRAAMQKAAGKGLARTFGQDLMRGEHVVGDTKPGLTWVGGNRDVEDLDEASRKNLAAGSSGTSIFDPVLCELAYRWFSPKGGVVLDPFAGGSVRGIVCAALGRRYLGIDLRPEQVEANRTQWPGVAEKLAPARTDDVPALRVDEIEGIRVVRDDFVIGGTKRRALDRILANHPAQEFVYATPAYGFAQIALAAAARACGKKATVIVAGRKVRHSRTKLAAELGAEIVEVAKAGYLAVVQKRARDEAEARGAYLVPFGMDDEMFVDAIASVARELPGDPPSEVWSVAGSGVLTRALQRAWPDASFHAVQIGKDPDIGNATLHVAPEKFEDDATDPPPFPSCSNYDAKAWRFIKEHAAPGALFWNLGADPDGLEAGPAPEWVCGDSAAVLPELDAAADMIFSCPPYGDLEVYSDDPADISTLAMADFDAAYAGIIAAAVDKLKDDRFACFVVGDYRVKGGFYANFISKTIDAFEAAGARLYNEMILVTSVGSLPIRAAKQFRTTRKAGKTHQNVLVFVKGDPRKATAALGPVDVSGALADIDPDDE